MKDVTAEIETEALYSKDGSMIAARFRHAGQDIGEWRNGEPSITHVDYIRKAVDGPEHFRIFRKEAVK